MYYPCSENKDADQLRGYREADLRLFSPIQIVGFPTRRLIYKVPTSQEDNQDLYYYLLCNFSNKYKCLTANKIGR